MPELGTPEISRLTWTVGLDAGAVELSPLQGSVTWDEIAIPSLRADCIIPYTEAAFDAADPLADDRVSLTALHEFTDDNGASLSPGNDPLPDDTITMDLGIRSRRRVLTADGHDVITLTTACDEALALDYKALTRTTLTSTTVRDVIDEILAVALPGASVDTSGDNASLPGAWDGTWDVGVTAFEMMIAAADSAGLIIRCDESRVWRLSSLWPASTGTPVNSSALESDRLEDITDRDTEWFDAVVIEFRWTDAAGVDHVEFDTHAPGTPSRTYFESRPTPYAPGTAEALYDRMIHRGRQWRSRQAINLIARPGWPLNFQATAEDDFHIGGIYRVQWSITDSSMTITGRSR